jgi:uncharacterized membrane protein
MMTTAHFHLLVNHLPLFGSMLAALVLAHGLWTKSVQTKIAAYNLLILSSLGAVVAYLTGESAEEAVENLQGISESAIERHEDASVIALVALIILGVLAILGLIFTMRQSRFTRRIAITVLLMSLLSFGIMAWTGYLGGQIRHTEFGTASVAHEDDDD